MPKIKWTNKWMNLNLVLDDDYNYYFYNNNSVRIASQTRFPKTWAVNINYKKKFIYLFKFLEKKSSIFSNYVVVFFVIISFLMEDSILNPKINWISWLYKTIKQCLGLFILLMNATAIGGI